METVLAIFFGFILMIIGGCISSVVIYATIRFIKDIKSEKI